MALRHVIRAIGTRAQQAQQMSTYALPPLKYKYDALEPHIDATTMQIHHTRHHQTYVSSLNGIIGGEHGAKLKGLALDEVVKSVATLPDDIRTATVNHAGGHLNHTLFFDTLRSDESASREPTGDLKVALEETFGSIDSFKDEFSGAAKKVFGSGWAWLQVDPVTKKLSITSTKNQENPLMKDIVASPGTPIMGIDVWEHAYYLLHRNARPKYIEAFFNVVDWDVVGANFSKALEGNTALVEIPMED